MKENLRHREILYSYILLSNKYLSLSIKEQIIANIKKFTVSEFCPNGGWPNFEDLTITVFSKEELKGAFLYDLELVFHCEYAGCCFIPGGNNLSRLRKKIKISESSFEVLDV